jgi:hypothetical protein
MVPAEFITGRTLMLSCNNEFADQVSCFANKSLSTGTVQSGSTANSIYIEQEYADGYWRNGLITIGYEIRKIRNSVGKRLDIDIGFRVTPSGTYEVQRHCTKVYANCGNFGQQTNFTGFLGIPEEYKVKT